MRMHPLFSAREHLWNISTFPQMLPRKWCDPASSSSNYVRQ